MMRVVRAGAGVVAAMIVAFAGMAVIGLTTSAARADTAVESFPVSFQVINENRSLVPCASNGGHYTVVGHITGPASALAGNTIPAAMLYVHGDGADESLWTFSAVPGYNYAANIAAKGYVSVTIDRLGYGGSGKPPGTQVCWGSEADVTHQIITQLRAGTYSATTDAGAPRTAPAIDRLGLAGHSAAGFIVMDEAYSFHDINALAVVASGDFPSGHTFGILGSAVARCGGASGTDGYVLLDTTDADAEADFFYDADPAVEDYAVAHRPPDACGGFNNGTTDLATDLAHNKQITVPVLTIGGADDAFFPNIKEQAKTFSASPKSTAVVIPDTGHAITLGRSAPVFTTDMANWLGANDLGVGAPSTTTTTKPATHKKHKTKKKHHKKHKPHHKKHKR